MHTFYAMNTTLHTLGLSASGQLEAESWFAFLEATLSRFQEESELSRLNRYAGSMFLASPLLYRTVETANRYYRNTSGLFNPYLGQVLSDLGYGVSFERLDEGSLKEPVCPVPTVMPQELPEFDPNMQSIYLPYGYSVDLGGFAKGWGAEKLAGMLRKGTTTGAIDAGGDIFVWSGTGERCPVAVVHPVRSERNALWLHLKEDAGVATSSTLKRSWDGAGGVRQHHILDPRTLRPAETDFIQATVIGPSLAEAEVLAKCVLLLGSKEAVPWLEKHYPRYAVIGFKRDGAMLTGGQTDLYELE